MIRVHQRESAFNERMHLRPIYKSLWSSFTICLLLSALVLVAWFLWTVIKKHKRTSSHTTLTPWPPRAMSSTKEESLPPPTARSEPVDPLLGDPLAGIYYPITSGQLAALADKQQTESPSAQAEDQDPETTESTDQESQLESRLAAYIRYFEDKDNNETWQRRVVKYEPADEQGRNVT